MLKVVQFIKEWGEAMGGIASAIALVFLIVQVILMKRQIFGDMAVRLHDEFFFKGKNPDIIRAIERNIFALKPGPIYSSNFLEEEQKENAIQYFEEEDLDDYLGVIELLDELKKRGCLDLDYIEALFGHYITQAWENKVVKKYIHTLREKKKNNNFYSGVERLAKQFNSNDED